MFILCKYPFAKDCDMEKMREIIHLNFDWEFTESFSSGFAKGEEVEITTVNLPHTCRETPFDYFDEGIYQMVCGYRRSLLIPGSARDKRIFLVIGAAAHSAQVYVNGIPCGERHNCGYTSFEVELTHAVTPGQSALVAIEVDSRENQNIPPFGYVMDYMTYGGFTVKCGWKSGTGATSQMFLPDRNHPADCKFNAALRAALTPYVIRFCWTVGMSAG